jgi:hypothetical protein
MNISGNSVCSTLKLVGLFNFVLFYLNNYEHLESKSKIKILKLHPRTGQEGPEGLELEFHYLFILGP